MVKFMQRWPGLKIRAKTGQNSLVTWKHVKTLYVYQIMICTIQKQNTINIIIIIAIFSLPSARANNHPRHQDSTAL